MHASWQHLPYFHDFVIYSYDRGLNLVLIICILWIVTAVTPIPNWILFLIGSIYNILFHCQGSPLETFKVMCSAWFTIFYETVCAWLYMCHVNYSLLEEKQLSVAITSRLLPQMCFADRFWWSHEDLSNLTLGFRIE